MRESNIPYCYINCTPSCGNTVSLAYVFCISLGDIHSWVRGMPQSYPRWECVLVTANFQSMRCALVCIFMPWDGNGSHTVLKQSFLHWQRAPHANKAWHLRLGKKETNIFFIPTRHYAPNTPLLIKTGQRFNPTRSSSGLYEKNTLETWWHPVVLIKVYLEHSVQVLRLFL